MVTDAIDKLEVILKVTERCNIDCSYCYYFNSENKDFEYKPAHISETTILSLINFLKQAIIDHKLKEIRIDIHGGEPLMLKKERFVKMVKILRESLDNYVHLTLHVQSNGILIDDEWIEIFKDFKIQVRISLDGTEEDNDLNRVDHHGKGTYRRVVQSIRKLQAAGSDDFALFQGVICVVNPSLDGSKTYRHFVDALAITNIHFIAPDGTRDSVTAETVKGVSQYLADVLEEWLTDDNREIKIQQFSYVLYLLARRESIAKMSHKSYLAITVRSDGQLAIEDGLRNTLTALFSLDLNVSDTSLHQFLNHPAVHDFYEKRNISPRFCATCALKNVCDSGAGLGESVMQRYSFVNKFNNASIYCKSHQDIIIRLAKFSLSKGVPWSRLKRNLNHPIR